MSMSCSQQFSRHNRGFTIIEIMVTLGILILIAAGVSTIFSSVADTVNKGKKVSELNRYAAQFERVMRQDFENITRDGFLVITHQLSNINTQLSPADASDTDGNGIPGSARRIDEIMFFSRGSYETSRRAVSPSMTARSSEAAIYYGHGQKRRPNLALPADTNNYFFNPNLSDTNIDIVGINQAALGVASTDGIPNPNQYATDWALLRNVTLLANAQSAGQELPDEVFGVERIANREWLEDSDRQIALQPAGRSIFNSLGRSGYYSATAPAGFVVPKSFFEYGVAVDTRPIYRASGLVDIVTDDLASVRTVLTALSADREPIDYWNLFSPPTKGHEDFMAQFWESDPSDPLVLSPLKARTLNIAAPASNHVRRMRKWMVDALPSIWDYENPTPIQLSRVRYEEVPTRLLYDENAFPLNDLGNRQRVFAETNQEMLGSSVFIPQCTEFVVEWSYGFIDATITNPTAAGYKQMLWYGLDRWVDANEDGLIDTSAGTFDQIVAREYSQRTNPGIPIFDIGPNPELILGDPANVGAEIATFGYPDLNGNSWLWPKFIRVTVSVADPSDLSIEHTFQMVFEISDASNN